MLHLFLDESGDLGFDFETGTPSRYMTIGVLAVSRRESVKAIRNAVVKTLKRKVNKPGSKHPRTELKGHETSIGTKRYFYNQICNEDFGIYSLTVDKSRVASQDTASPEKTARLYNFVAQQVLKKMPFDDVTAGVELIVDKSKSKLEIAKFNSYLLTQLEGLLDPKIGIQIRHQDSCVDRGLSAADLFVWGIGRYYERGDAEWLDIFRDKVVSQEVYP